MFENLKWTPETKNTDSFTALRKNAFYDAETRAVQSGYIGRNIAGAVIDVPVEGGYASLAILRVTVESFHASLYGKGIATMLGLNEGEKNPELRDMCLQILAEAKRVLPDSQTTFRTELRENGRSTAYLITEKGVYEQELFLNRQAADRTGLEQAVRALMEHPVVAGAVNTKEEKVFMLAKPEERLKVSQGLAAEKTADGTVTFRFVSQDDQSQQEAGVRLWSIPAADLTVTYDGNPYMSLRELQLSLLPEDVKISLDPGHVHQVYAALVDFVWEEGAAWSIALRYDGSCSIYHGNGAVTAIVGEGFKEIVREFLIRSCNAVKSIEKTEEYPLPAAKEAAVYLKCGEGIYTMTILNGVEPENDDRGYLGYLVNRLFGYVRDMLNAQKS